MDIQPEDVELMIKQGHWDDIVTERFYRLHPRARLLGTLESRAQDAHRAAHPNGPFGFEYCSECVGAHRV